MIGRRDVMGGSVLAGLAAAVSPEPAAAEQREGDAITAQAVNRLREVLERQQNSCFLGACGAIAEIRAAQAAFLKANQKFPDFLDVGIDIWQAAYDWHIKNRQPINTTRLPDGRYGLAYMFTTLVLRPDNTPNYVSFGYDAK